MKFLALPILATSLLFGCSSTHSEIKDFSQEEEPWELKTTSELIVGKWAHSDTKQVKDPQAGPWHIYKDGSMKDHVYVGKYGTVKITFYGYWKLKDDNTLLVQWTELGKDDNVYDIRRFPKFKGMYNIGKYSIGKMDANYMMLNGKKTRSFRKISSSPFGDVADTSIEED